MAYSLYKKESYTLNGQEGTINQLDGRLMFINNKYLSNSDKSMYEFTKRQRELQTFLFYRYFYMNDMPLICTEGKTDVLYIKAALLNYADEYPELIDENGFLFHFFKRTKRMKNILKYKKMVLILGKIFIKNSAVSLKIPRNTIHFLINFKYVQNILLFYYLIMNKIVNIL